MTVKIFKTLNENVFILCTTNYVLEGKNGGTKDNNITQTEFTISVHL